MKVTKPVKIINLALMCVLAFQGFTGGVMPFSNKVQKDFYPSPASPGIMPTIPIVTVVAMKPAVALADNSEAISDCLSAAGAQEINSVSSFLNEPARCVKFNGVLNYPQPAVKVVVASKLNKMPDIKVANIPSRLAQEYNFPSPRGMEASLPPLSAIALAMVYMLYEVYKLADRKTACLAPPALSLRFFKLRILRC